MPKLFGLHNLYGALAAILVGTLLSLLRVNGLLQLLFVVVAYLGGSFLAHDLLRKRRAAHAPEGLPEEEPTAPRFHHFDSRALDQIQEERARSERREVPEPGAQREPAAPEVTAAAPFQEAPTPNTSAHDESEPQHFDARALERIERERRDTGRRDG